MTRTAESLELIGGHLCLDFANTASARSGPLRREYLAAYPDLVAWSRHAGVLSQAEAEVLLHSATCHPDLAQAELQQAVALRETMYRILDCVADRREPGIADLAEINSMLHRALIHRDVMPAEQGFEWVWARDPSELGQMLWPIVGSCAELLTSAQIGRLRQCAREGCDWLFLDLSKNQSRRWCSMALCGSRVKAHHHYRRKKKEEEG